MQNWTPREFEIYLLAFAAHCNFEETVEESKYILERFDESEFYKVHNEIVQDKEQESIQKITNYLQDNNVTYAQKSELLREVKAIFFADGTIDTHEKETFNVLKKILS